VKALRFHEAARSEAKLATVWYAARSQRSAQRFLDELQMAYSSAANSPLLYPLYLHGTRRILLKRFPFFVVYFAWQDEVYIVAVVHAKRRPGYWSSRL
jgi:plasmid stabilization system protein ParE